MSWFDRLRSHATVNYNEDTEESEEDLEEGLNFDSPLASPSRPVQSREGSPQELAHPTLNDNVDEELAQVSQTLLNIGHTPLFRRQSIGHNSLSRGVPEGEEASPVEDIEDIVVEESGVVIEDPLIDNCQEPPEVPDPPVMPFDTENGEDEARALHEALRSLQNYEWNQDDILFYFGQIEIKMAAAGVKKQFTKFQILSSIVPTHVINQIKKFLRKSEADFTNNDSYKQLKQEVLRIFGPRPEAAIERAMKRVLVGPPSSLARELKDDICHHELDCQCCPAVISYLWKKQLSGQVRAGIAHLKLTSATFDQVTQLADDIHMANLPLASSMPSVSAVASPGASLNETQPGIPYPVPEVNAVRSNRGNRGRGGRGRGGRGRGGQAGAQSNASAPSSSSTTRHRGTRHPDLPPGEWSGCQMHFKHGKQAFFCSEPATCPWKNIFAQRPSK